MIDKKDFQEALEQDLKEGAPITHLAALLINTMCTTDEIRGPESVLEVDEARVEILKRARTDRVTPPTRSGYSLLDLRHGRVVHVGMWPHRIRANQQEGVFARRWKLFAKNGLKTLLGGEDGGGVSQRDALVAATVIQWLGSPIGSEWLADCLAKIVKR